MQAALLVRGFPPKVGLVANFLYTHIVSLTGRQLFKDDRWVRGGGEPKKTGARSAGGLLCDKNLLVY
jgi:hypothetical protein